MSTKAVTQPYQVVTNGDMSADLVSISTDIKTQDNVGYQVIYTGTPTGDFLVQGTINGIDWETLDIGTPGPTAIGMGGSFVVSLTQVPYAKLRLAYTASSGMGLLNVWVMVKRLGG